MVVARNATANCQSQVDFFGVNKILLSTLVLKLYGRLVSITEYLQKYDYYYLFFNVLHFLNRGAPLWVRATDSVVNRAVSRARTMYKPPRESKLAV